MTIPPKIKVLGAGVLVTLKIEDASTENVSKDSIQNFEIFHWVENQLYIENTPLLEIAEKIGTPCYVYSQTAIENQYQAFTQAFGNIPCQINYAVKANSNLAVLNTLAKLNSGFDIVSVGELERVLKAGGKPEQIIFSGVGKTKSELKRALQLKLGCIQVESEAEIFRLQTLAQEQDTSATITIRVNPDVDAESHPFISTGKKETKFGLSLSDAKNLILRAKDFPNLKIKGLGFHIGSQITDMKPVVRTLEKVLALMDDLNASGIDIKDLNVGGGLGIRYQNENPPSPEQYVKTILKCIGPRKLKLHIEPGRSIVGASGVLLTRVEYLKKTPHKKFAIVDAGMNDLLRPALYSAWQEILNIQKHDSDEPVVKELYDIVGPVCETSDFLGLERKLSIKKNDILAIMNAGAYGFSMSSNYNSRPRAAEVLVKNQKFKVVRVRETLEDLFKGEISDANP